MKLSLGMPIDMGRRPAPAETESIEDDDIGEVEPVTLRQPSPAPVSEEVTGIRQVGRAREPKIVPPKGGEEMLRNRQEYVRTRATVHEKQIALDKLTWNTHAAISALESLFDEIKQPGVVLSQSLTVQYIRRLTDAREELETLVARTRKLDDTGELSLRLIDIHLGLMQTEDLLESLHTSFQNGA
ncbi:MAG: hypothetical protein ABIO72_00885 [Patescibacteria group bacterium]